MQSRDQGPGSGVAGTDEFRLEANGGELSDDVAVLCVSRTVAAPAGDGHG